MNRIANAQAATVQDRKDCVACGESVRLQAKVCPHCHSSQSPRSKLVAGALKWIGGATASVSLLIGAYQVTSIWQSVQDRRETVEELVRAANLQFKTGDLSGALSMLDDALALEPGSRKAREQQVVITLASVRQYLSVEGTKYREVLDPLLPVLYQEAASANPRNAADALAHIGWANY